MPAGVSFLAQYRWIFLLMMFSCFFVLSSQRINMSIAILNMVNWTSLKGNTSHICPMMNRTVLHAEDGEFLWTTSHQAQVLASYFYGLILMHLPAEILVGKFSVQFLALIGMALSTICNFLTPAASRWHIGFLVFLQITKGMGHAVLFPAFSCMLCKWIPTRHLVRFSAYTTCGIPTGAFFTVLLGGILCHNPQYRWPYLFYFSGTIGVVWCLVWLYLCYDVTFMPILTSNRSISRTHLPQINHLVPYRKILSSKPFWGYVAGGVASYWMIALNIFVLPTYMKIVFGLGLEWNGMLSSFPNVLQAFVYLLSFSTLKKTTKKTAQRRFIACIGMSTFATCMVVLTFVKCRKAMGILLMTIGVGASGFNFAALSVLPVDMSPTFSGLLSAIMNTIGSTAGSALPLMVGYLMEGEREIIEWNKVFYASAFVTFISMILFMAYSSCRIQEWNISSKLSITPKGFASRKRASEDQDSPPASSSKHLDANSTTSILQK